MRKKFYNVYMQHEAAHKGTRHINHSAIVTYEGISYRVVHMLNTIYGSFLHSTETMNKLTHYRTSKYARKYRIDSDLSTFLPFIKSLLIMMYSNVKIADTKQASPIRES